MYNETFLGSWPHQGVKILCFTPSCSCLPETVSLTSVIPTASRLTSNVYSHTLRMIHIIIKRCLWWWWCVKCNAVDQNNTVHKKKWFTKCIKHRKSLLMCIGPCIILITEEQNPTRCHLLLYYAYVRLNMFWAPLCPSSGAHDVSIGYHIGRLVLEPALNFQPAATREPDGLCGNQCYCHELLMMGIMVPKTC